jgi:hypothetical protein
MQTSKIKRAFYYGMTVGFGIAFTGIATVSISKIASLGSDLRDSINNTLERRR